MVICPMCLKSTGGEPGETLTCAHCGTEFTQRRPSDLPPPPEDPAEAPPKPRSRPVPPPRAPKPAPNPQLFRWLAAAPYLATLLVLLTLFVLFSAHSKRLIEPGLLLGLLLVGAGWISALIVLFGAPRGSGGVRGAAVLGMLLSLASLVPLVIFCAIASGPMPGA